MRSARIPDAPPHQPWLSWETAVRSSPSDGGTSSIVKGVPFAGNPGARADSSLAFPLVPPEYSQQLHDGLNGGTSENSTPPP
jgi:hypothetical protein